MDQYGVTESRNPSCGQLRRRARKPHPPDVQTSCFLGTVSEKEREEKQTEWLHQA